MSEPDAEEDSDDYAPTPVKSKAKPAARGKAAVASSKATKPASTAAAKRSTSAKGKAVRYWTALWWRYVIAAGCYKRLPMSGAYHSLSKEALGSLDVPSIQLSTFRPIL